MVITEYFFGVILKLFARGMFLREFTVSSSLSAAVVMAELMTATPQ